MAGTSSPCSRQSLENVALSHTASKASRGGHRHVTFLGSWAAMSSKSSISWSVLPTRSTRLPSLACAMALTAGTTSFGSRLATVRGSMMRECSIAPMKPVLSAMARTPNAW
jgi:hypothetical protein